MVDLLPFILGSLSTKRKILPSGPLFKNFLKTVSKEVNLTSQCSDFLEVLSVRKGGEILIFGDKDPKGYELSCCGSYGLVCFFILVQIAVFGQIWAEIKCMVYVALSKKPLKQFKN